MGRYAPFPVAIRCLDYLNEYGKTEEGLYRIPGSTQQVGNLRTVFDAGCDIDLLTTLSTREMEPSAVASCFKLWLRERESLFGCLPVRSAGILMHSNCLAAPTFG